jgi:hypothetical protein
MKKSLVLLVASFLVTAVFAGDIVTLSNQMTFEGKVTRIRKCEIVFKTDDAKYTIPAEDILSIQFADTEDKVYRNYLKKELAEDNNCLKGTFDAQNFHGKRGGHFILGVLFGPFAILGTALPNPTPYRGKETMMASQNKDIFNDPEYLQCYKKKAKGQLIGMEAAGWGAWIVFALIASASAN